MGFRWKNLSNADGFVPAGSNLKNLLHAERLGGIFNFCKRWSINSSFCHRICGFAV